MKRTLLVATLVVCMSIDSFAKVISNPTSHTNFQKNINQPLINQAADNFKNFQEYLKNNNLQRLVIPLDLPSQLTLPNAIAPPTLINPQDSDIQSYLKNINLNNVPSIIPFDSLNNAFFNKKIFTDPNLSIQGNMDALNINVDQGNKITPPITKLLPLDKDNLINLNNFGSLNKLIPLPDIIKNIFRNIIPSINNIDNPELPTLGLPSAGLIPLDSLPKLIKIEDPKKFSKLSKFMKGKFEKIWKAHAEKNAEGKDEDNQGDENSNNGDIDLTNVWNINLTPDVPSDILSPILSSVLSSIPFFKSIEQAEHEGFKVFNPFGPMLNMFRSEESEENIEEPTGGETAVESETQEEETETDPSVNIDMDKRNEPESSIDDMDQTETNSVDDTEIAEIKETNENEGQLIEGSALETSMEMAPKETEQASRIKDKESEQTDNLVSTGRPDATITMTTEAGEEVEETQEEYAGDDDGVDDEMVEQADLWQSLYDKRRTSISEQ